MFLMISRNVNIKQRQYFKFERHSKSWEPILMRGYPNSYHSILGLWDGYGRFLNIYDASSDPD